MFIVGLLVGECLNRFSSHFSGDYEIHDRRSDERAFCSNGKSWCPITNRLLIDNQSVALPINRLLFCKRFAALVDIDCLRLTRFSIERF